MPAGTAYAQGGLGAAGSTGCATGQRPPAGGVGGDAFAYAGQDPSMRPCAPVEGFIEVSGSPNIAIALAGEGGDGGDHVEAPSAPGDGGHADACGVEPASRSSVGGSGRDGALCEP